MTTTPAPGNEPLRPNADGSLAPIAPGAPPTKSAPLTKTQKILTGIVVGAVLVIATLGFVGSYSAVTDLALAKGFGQFAHAFPVAIDAGIIAFLALDLLLTWRRIAFPLLRYTAWGLTAATIAFNAVVAWPDPIGTGMHGVIPVLFVIAVEAARHAIGRIADITADKHIEGPPVSRWLLNPPGTFVLWRRQRLWGIRSWDTVVDLERQRRIYRAQRRQQYGRRWRRKATADQLLVLQLTADGMSVQDAIDLPKREAQKQADTEAKREAEARAKTDAEAEAKHQAELRTAQAEAKRRTEIAEAEAAEAEAKSRAEAAAEVARLEVEAKQHQQTEAARLLVAETEAKLADIARTQQEAEAEADLKRHQRAAEQQRLQAEAAEAQAQTRREEQARQRAQRISAEAAAVRSASASDTPTSGSATSITAPRAKKQAEVEEVLTRIAEADDPKSVSLEWVMEHFDLKQTTAYDRLKTAQDLYEKSRSKSA